MSNPAPRNPHSGNDLIITHGRLLQILDYVAETGDFRWRFRAERCVQWNAKYAGTIAGTVRCDGYRRIQIDGHFYYAHRLAWLYVVGDVPPNQIDHIDMNPNNNRFCNLRLATSSENNRNRRPQSNNTSGVKGVHWSKTMQKWIARVKVNGREHFVGSFDSMEHAAIARAPVAKKLHGEFARITE